MSKKAARPNKAKSIAAQPLFRCRQERPGKGKGSYRRQASQQNWEAFFMACHSPGGHPSGRRKRR
ncbi:ribosome alternative rescue factor ArfA [Pseudomonas dryadis]|uniref:Ribosome alternative rescue factor ArfA n=1 Tax=Phytopseudomonas dryadis TaxID=2487520 RepID=A0A4Q9R092_9GAMM|nr:ribosome alternative rescue factor ArfA [Pseudomonas dryadis]TBV08967.1 ribosome alternative rescue factor ArfA [Pseudomonas dryadis]TBV15152.1 ribosome alternative rescue factor ArfA [Pseudomonas sp. FRB 230]